VVVCFVFGILFYVGLGCCGFVLFTCVLGNLVFWVVAVQLLVFNFVDRFVVWVVNL